MKHALLVCVLACFTQPTLAAPPPPPVAATPVNPSDEAAADAEARAHFDNGTRAFAAGEYDAAVAEFDASYRARAYPDLLVNIASCYERIYQPERARKNYERFLEEAPPTAELRALAEKRLRVLRRLPGTIFVEATRDATIAITGPAAYSATAPAPHRFTDLPPGDYHVRITLPDHVSVDESVTLLPGETQALNRRLQHEVEQLTVFSQPDAARVFLDDKEEGVTPFSRTVETGRARSLRLEAPDFPAYREKVDLSAGKPVFRRIRMPRPRTSGRTELVLASMAYGGFVAGSVSAAIGGSKVTNGTGLFVLVPTTVAGVGLGFLASWALTDENLKVGHSSIIIGSTLFGGILGTELAYGLGLTNSPDQQYPLAIALLGSGLGLGAGILTAWLADTTPGDAAMVNSGGIWGGLTGLLLTESLSFSHAEHDRAFGWISLGTTSVGIAAGAVFARFFEISRSHVGIVDAAGLLGLVLGYGIGYAAGNDGPEADNGTVCPSSSVRRCVSGARYGLGGLAIGLVTAAILTRRFQANLPQADALITRHDDKWALGIPRLRFDMVRVPEGIAQQGILDLAHGEF